MADPAKPLPGFVEGWAPNSFHGQQIASPTGFASLDADEEGVKTYIYSVTGEAGDTTLSATGLVSTIGGNNYGATILHDDGTYGVYTVNNETGGTTGDVTIRPPLRADTTGGECAALIGLLSDQHYGLPGYKALARHIYSVTNGSAYRNRFAGQIAARSATTGWTGISGGTVGYKQSTGFQPDSGSYSYMRARGPAVVISGANAAGSGVRNVQALGGHSGQLEVFVGLFAGANYNVKVIIDGDTIHDETYPGFHRVVVPFGNATTGTVEITNPSGGTRTLLLGDCTWWVYDREDIDWDAKFIDKDAKVVVLGDSWSARYDGGLGAELQQAMVDDGGTGTVTTIALGSQTAEWGLEQMPLVAAENPDVVVVEFFTNDCNQFGVTGSERWLKATYRIGLACQDIGAKPLFVMPLPTGGNGQTINHGRWAELIGAGLPI
jgi:hypothetical protein